MSSIRRHWVQRFLAAALVAVPALASCQRPTGTRAPVSFGVNPTRANLPTVSLLVPPDERLVPLVTQLQLELESEVNVVVTPVSEGVTSPIEVGDTIARAGAKAVILVNNSAARLYRDWSRTQASPPASIILLASFAERLHATIANSTAIAYEVPAVTSLTGLRTLGVKVDQAGVIYRSKFRDYVEDQRKLAGVEKIPFVVRELDDVPHVRDLKAAIVELSRAGVDVLWLPNDNALLTRQLVQEAWLPYLERFRLPVVVGVPSLVRADANFGTYAAIPDMEALAIQAADLLFEIMEDDWSVTGHGVTLPVSVKTYVAPQLGQRYGMQQTTLQNVDVIVGDEALSTRGKAGH